MVSAIQPPSQPEPGPLAREAALETVALAAELLLTHGQTTERIVVAAERLGRALGVSVTALPYWGELTVEIDGTTLSKIVPIKPLGVDIGRVPVRGARFLCSRFDDAGLLFVSRRERPGRVGFDRSARRWPC
jgi:hypothetical protein